MDKVIDKIAALGVPGLVLVVVMVLTGLSGAAAFTAGLAFLGGPLGMLGGLATLGVLALVAKAIAKYGFAAVFRGVLNRLKADGMTNDEIKATVADYWFVSADLKRRLSDHVDQWGAGRGESTGTDQ